MHRRPIGTAKWQGFALCFFSSLARAAPLVASGTCLAPEAPIGSEPDLVAAYRREILTDYERFFAESSAYIACLDEERGAAMAALSRAVSEHEAIFATPTQTDDPVQEEEH